jgi:Zn-dependent protease
VVFGQSLPTLVRALSLDLLVMALSLSVHEFAHAWVAYRLGDDTAEREGRLSLSPASHVDPLGTLLIPALNLLIANGFGFIGWARPTPVSPLRFRPQVPARAGMALVAAAGPISNLLLALGSVAVLRFMERQGLALSDGNGRMTALAALMGAMFQINVGLAIFNVLPIPPLDGSRLLPRSMDHLKESIAPYSLWILLLIVNIPFLSNNLVSRPMAVVMNALLSLFRVHAGGFGS